MVRIFQILAVVLTGAAAFLFWRGDSDMTFVVAALAACSFFLSIRYQIKERIDERNAAVAAAATDDDAGDERSLPNN